jgi:hypothetical protein
MTKINVLAPTQLTFFFLAFFSWRTTTAFTALEMIPNVYSLTSSKETARRSLLLYNTEKNEEEEPSPYASFDLDTERKRLESLVVGAGTKNTKTSKSTTPDEMTTTTTFSLERFLKAKQITIPPPPPLSTIERDRRLAEIDMLKALVDGDEASSQLWDLWYSERGAKALALLQQADQLMGDPTSWQECERILVALIDDYGIYFVEPVNRLATLYYLQGRMEWSYKLCQAILKVKPWHFGALAGIVQVCIGLGDRNAARVWSEKRLPTTIAGTSFPPFASPDDDDGPVNPRREEWVERAVVQAKELLKKAERDIKERYFGKPEDYYRKAAAADDNNIGNSNQNRILGTDEDSNSWQ